MRIDVHEGKVFVFGRPRGDRQFRFYNYPKHFLVAFVWEGGEFRRVPVLDIPGHLLAEENILPCVPAVRSSLVTIPAKEANWCPASSVSGKFGKAIVLRDYDELASAYACRAGGEPQTE